MISNCVRSQPQTLHPQAADGEVVLASVPHARRGDSAATVTLLLLEDTNGRCSGRPHNACSTGIRSRKRTTILKYLITGATSGIGLCIVQRLASAGHRIVATGRRPASELPNLFPDVEYIPLDLSSGVSVCDRLGLSIDQLDRAILCAGTGHYRPIEDETPSEIDRVVSVNFRATAEICGAVYHPLAATRGRLAIIGSVARRGSSAMPIYSASKAALRGFSRSLQSEWEGRVRVCHLDPWATRTPMLLQRGLVGDNGSLIYILSLSYFLGYPGASVYAGTKDRVAVFARSLRKALRPRGIKVLTVMPGPLDTEHARRYAPPGASGQGRMQPRVAAERIIARMGTSGTLVPGSGPMLAGLLGRLFPTLATALMRRSIFEKLSAPSGMPDSAVPDLVGVRVSGDETARRSTADA